MFGLWLKSCEISGLGRKIFLKIVVTQKSFIFEVGADGWVLSFNRGGREAISRHGNEQSAASFYPRQGLTIVGSGWREKSRQMAWMRASWIWAPLGSPGRTVSSNSGQ